MKNVSSRTALLLFALAVAAGLVAPALFQDGMFADGVLYAAVSHNLANGYGSFWHPFFSDMNMTHFHEQPPLELFLQSLFFRAFGDGIYPERIYQLVLALIDGWLIVRVWGRIAGKDKRVRSLAGWAVLLFFLSPVVFWAFTNNVIETTMAAFALAATDALIAALVEKRKVALNLSLAAVWLIATSLCKGPQGLFPVVLPAALWIGLRTPQFKKALGISILLGAIVAAFYLVCWQSACVREAFTSWFERRILNTFGGGNDTTSSRFRLLYEMLLDLLPLLGVGAVVLLAGRKRAHRDVEMRRWGHVMLLVALSASLPLMITREQRGFYLTTSLPFFALAFAAYTAPATLALTERIKNWKPLTIFSGIALVAVLTVTILIAGTPKRDAEALHDIRITGKMAGPGAVIASDDVLFNDWSVMNYYARFFRTSFTTDKNLPAVKYYISISETPPEGWKEVSTGLQKFHWFVKGDVRR